MCGVTGPMGSMLRRAGVVAVAVIVLVGCEPAALPSSESRVPPVVAINGVAGEAVRWCDEGGCIDLGVESPESLPAAWLPYEADLPLGARVQRGVTRDIDGPPVELDVGDRGVANIGGFAAMVCYTVGWDDRDDAITYCWATGDVIP